MWSAAVLFILSCEGPPLLRSKPNATLSKVHAFSRPYVLNFPSRFMQSLHRNRKLRPNKSLNPLLSSQPQTKQSPLAFQISVKIKKRTALPLRHHPLRQLRKRDIRRSVLEFVTFFRLHDFFANADQLLSQLLLP